VSCAKTAEPIEMSFETWTRVGQRKDVGEPIRRECTLAQPGKYDWTVRVRRWCAALCQITSTTCSHLHSSNSFLIAACCAGLQLLL